MNNIFIIVLMKTEYITLSNNPNNYNQLLDRLFKKSSAYEITVQLSPKDPSPKVDSPVQFGLNKQNVRPKSAMKSDNLGEQLQSQSQSMLRSVSIKLPKEMEDKHMYYDEFLQQNISRGVQTEQVHFESQGCIEQNQNPDEDDLEKELNSYQTLFQLRDFDKLVENLYKFRNSYKNTSERIRYKWNLIMGKCKKQKKQYGDAVKYILEAIQFFQHYELNFSEDQYANVLNTLGLIYLQMQDWKMATIIFQYALEIYHKLNNTTKFSNVLNNLGSLYLRAGMINQALETLSQAYRIKVLVHGRQSKKIFSSLYNLVECHKQLQEYEKAEKILKYMRILSNQQGSSKDLADINRRLGMIEHLRGRVNHAKTYYQISKQILEDSELQEQIEYGHLLRDIGLLELEFGDRNKTRKYFTQASKLYDVYLWKETHIANTLERNLQILNNT